MRQRLLAREISLDDVLDECFERAAAVEPHIRAFLHLDEAGARRQAAALRAQLDHGAEPGPLFGIPVSLKDNIDVAGVETTLGSRTSARYVPSVDSDVARRLSAAGAILVGKTNLPELALIPRTINAIQEETVNPWDTDRSAGGSSGGAAASVAAGVTPIAIGTDGGGSVRIPAAFCGVAGLHPSPRRVSRAGVAGGNVLYSSVGPIAADGRDLELAFDVIAEPAPRAWTGGLTDHGRDPVSADLQVAWVPTSGFDDLASYDHGAVGAVEKAATEWFAELGIGLTHLEPSAQWGGPEWLAEFDRSKAGFRSASFADLVDSDTDRELLTPYGRAAIERGATITTTAFAHTLESRDRAIRSATRLFGAWDLLVSPTVGCVSPPTSVGIYERPTMVGYTFPVNFVGFAALSIPCATWRGLPVGLQLIAAPGAERLLLAVMQRFEQTGCAPAAVTDPVGSAR